MRAERSQVYAAALETAQLSQFILGLFGGDGVSPQDLYRTWTGDGAAGKNDVPRNPRTQAEIRRYLKAKGYDY